MLKCCLRPLTGWSLFAVEWQERCAGGQGCGLLLRRMIASGAGEVECGLLLRRMIASGAGGAGVLLCRRGIRGEPASRHPARAACSFAAMQSSCSEFSAVRVSVMRRRCFAERAGVATPPRQALPEFLCLQRRSPQLPSSAAANFFRRLLVKFIGWEMTRMLALFLLQPYSKKKLRPSDVMKFPWDGRVGEEKRKSPPARSTEGRFLEVKGRLEKKAG